MLEGKGEEWGRKGHCSAKEKSYCSAKVYTDSGELGTMKTNKDCSVDRSFFSKNMVRKDEIECGVSNSFFKNYLVFFC